MLESYPKIFELCISMITALLGLAYPLFIDKINKMAEKYNSRRISEKFKSETSYRIFNVLLLVCIIELFTFPVIIKAFNSGYANTLLITIQGICVFVLSVIMVRLYHLIIIYTDPYLFFNRIRANDTIEELFADLQILIYASKNKSNIDLYNDVLNELAEQILNIQQCMLQNHDK